MDEIERKFLINSLPDIVDQLGIREERYFLYRDGTSEIRIQHKEGGGYTLQTKTNQNDLANVKQTLQLTAPQFEHLKALAVSGLVRRIIAVPNIANATVKVYEGAYKGLIRAEVEFESEAAARTFNVPGWFGTEITDTKLGRDKLLVQLNAGEFKSLLEQYSSQS